MDPPHQAGSEPWIARQTDNEARWDRDWEWFVMSMDWIAYLSSDHSPTDAAGIIRNFLACQEERYGIERYTGTHQYKTTTEKSREKAYKEYPAFDEMVEIVGKKVAELVPERKTNVFQSMMANRIPDRKLPTTNTTTNIDKNQTNNASTSAPTTPRGDTDVDAAKVTFKSPTTNTTTTTKTADKNKADNPSASGHTSPRGGTDEIGAKGGKGTSTSGGSENGEKNT
jgi:hypothetical protein